MGKRKKSAFIQQQRFNEHIMNKGTNNSTFRNINRMNREIKQIQDEYNSDLVDHVNKIIENEDEDNKMPLSSKLDMYNILLRQIDNNLNKCDKEKEEIRYNNLLEDKQDIENLQSLDYLDDVKLPEDYTYDEEFKSFMSAIKESQSSFYKLKIHDTKKAMRRVIDDDSIITKFLCTFFRFATNRIIEDKDKNNIRGYLFITHMQKNIMEIFVKDPYNDILIKSIKDKFSN